MDRRQLLGKLDKAWSAFRASYDGLPEALMNEPGVVGDWSVKDVIAHVTTWDAEALKYLPLIIAGGTTPRYASYGGIDAFNADMWQRKRDLPLTEVRRQLKETHDRLVALVDNIPEDQIRRESRSRRRLRLDTYSHYPEHTAAIRAWREQRGV